MVDLNALSAANAKRWANAKLTRLVEANNIALHLFKAKARYQAVEANTGVPWPIIAVIHERESSQQWGASLAQGDRWDQVSQHVPKGRGPFKSWEEAAIDALVNCAPFLAHHKDWSLGGALTALETYNGIGYAAGPVDRVTGQKYPPQASPYLWAGTDQYRSGKYFSDGKFDPNKVDSQMGCAALLKALMALDPTITFTGAKIIPIDKQPAKPGPSVANPSPGSLGAFIASIFNAIFRRK